MNNHIYVNTTHYKLIKIILALKNINQHIIRATSRKSGNTIEGKLWACSDTKVTLKLGSGNHQQFSPENYELEMQSHINKDTLTNHFDYANYI